VLLERDSRTGASYIVLVDRGIVARTINASDLVMVDVDSDDRPVGVELAMDYRKITEDTWRTVVNAWPSLKEVFPDARTLIDFTSSEAA
jgi:hypothetical protein